MHGKFLNSYKIQEASCDKISDIAVAVIVIKNETISIFVAVRSRCIHTLNSQILL